MNESYLTRNVMPITLMLLVSLMFGMPHIINIGKISYGLYNPVPIQNGLILNMDENLFAPGFQDAADGHLIVRNPQLKEYKNLPSHMDVFPFFIIGFVASLFSVGAKEIFIASDFIFPPLAFLMLFVVARKLFSLKKELAALTALLIVLFQSFTNFLLALITLNIQYFQFSSTDFLGYSKLYAPEFIVIPFLAALVVLYEAFRKDSMKYAIAASLLGALLFYTYIYYSTFFWGTFAIMALIELYRKRNFRTVKKLLAISVPAAVLAIPYIMNFIALSRSEAYRDTLLRVGLETSWFIHITIIYAFVSLVVLAIAYRVMANRFTFLFVASMLLTATILMNIQVITGYSIQPWHWGYRVLEFLYFFIAACVIQTGLTLGRKNIDNFSSKLFSFLNNKAVIRALIVVFIIYGLGYSVSAASATGDIYKLTEGEADMYRWLDSNTPPDSAIMTLSTKESLQVPSFTHNNVYLPDGITSGRTTEELVDRFVFAHALYNATEALSEKLNVNNDAFRLEYLNKLYEGKRFNLRDFEKYYFINYFFHTQFFYGRHDYQQKNPDIPEAIGFYFPLSFRAYVMQKLQSQSYKIYDFDYVLVGPYEREVGSSIANNYAKVYSNTEFDVYAVRK